MVEWSSLTKGKKVLFIHSQKSLATIFGFPFTEELLQAQCHDNHHQIIHVSPGISHAFLHYPH